VGAVKYLTQYPALLPPDVHLAVALQPADYSRLRLEAVEPSVALGARRSAAVPQVVAVQQELSLEMSVQWKPLGVVVHLAEPLEPQALPVLLQELVSRLARSAQQVPQVRALPPQEPQPLDLARVPLLVSLQLESAVLQEREQPREVSPLALQPLASEPVAMPLLSRNAPPLQQPLPVPLRLSGAREPFPRLPPSRNWSAFSFPLRQNPATGQ
jgi:hypothetical protein